ncbi:MAG: hypothetical protein GX100_13265 [candidate division WS1 bacterium]|jgi:hypothetical protein|nr:hypothetical protein [candidate division WS1 bacterium]
MADKIQCPKCGTENYTTDVVCLSCGANLQEPQRPPEAKAAEKVEGVPMAPSGPATPAKPEEPPPSPPSAWESAMPFIRALGIALALTLIEVILIYALNKDHQYPKSAWGLRFPVDMVPKIMVATLVIGLARGVLIGGLLHLTAWSPTVSLLIGGALGWTGLGTLIGGLVVGFAIGLSYSGHQPVIKN